MQILKVMIVVFLIFAFLFLPIILNIGIVLPLKTRKGYYSINLFGLIPINSGYVQLINEGICLHFTKNKAKIISYKDILNIKTTIKPIKDFQIIKLNTCLDVNCVNNEFTCIYLSFLIRFMSDIIGNVLKINKNYLKFNSTVNLVDENVFNIYFQTKVMFNLIVIIIEIFRLILEKVINVFGFQK